MDTRKIATIAFSGAIVAMALLGFAVVSPFLSTRSPAAIPHISIFEKAVSSEIETRQGSDYTLGEPPLAATFVAAYARGDEVTANRIASPIYQVEWTRRGLTPASRHDLLPTPDPTNASDVWLRFTYAGGGLDQNGFGHLLYVAQPPGSSSNAFPSIWRVDTDPRGRVIWLEMVYLFSNHSAAVLPVRGGNATIPLSLRNSFAPTQPLLVAGVRSAVGPEAYYAMSVSPASTNPISRASTRDIVFLGVDEDGQIRPGAWSYGQSNSGSSAYGQITAAPTVTLDPNLAALRQSYIQTLH